MRTRKSMVRGAALVMLALACHPILAQQSATLSTSTRMRLPTPTVSSGTVSGVPANGVSVGTYRPKHRSLWTRLRFSRKHGLKVQRGVLTVDGLTAKVGVNFKIVDMRYLYIFVPGKGTTVISDRPFEGAVEQRAAFQGKVLTVASGGNRLQLTSERRLLSKRSAFVRFDPQRGPSASMPLVSYGSIGSAPYEWPGSLLEVREVAVAHPVPLSLRPARQQITTCTAAENEKDRACSTRVQTVKYGH